MKEARETKKNLENKLNFLEIEILSNQSKFIIKPLIKSPLPERGKPIEKSLQKVVKEWQLLQERRNERMHKKHEKSQKEQEKIENYEKNEKERTKHEKLERIVENVAEIQNRMKAREIETLKENEKVKELMKKAPNLIKKFQKAIEIEENEEKARVSEKMAHLKEKFKPLDKKELETHAKIYEESMKQHQVEKADKSSIIQSFKPSYKSRLHEILATEETEKKSNQLAEKEKKFELLHKLKEFDEKVKKEHFPEIDPRKKQLLQEGIFKLNHPALKFFVPKEMRNFTEESLEKYNETVQKSPRTIGKAYLSYAKEHKTFKKTSRSLERIPDKHIKYENYLGKFRGKIVEKDELYEVLIDEGLSLIEKKEKVFAKAEVWEGLAERKELMMKVNGGRELGDQADELRIKAMKAKLALLRESEQV